MLNGMNLKSIAKNLNSSSNTNCGGSMEGLIGTMNFGITTILIDLIV